MNIYRAVLPNAFGYGIEAIQLMTTKIG